MDGKSIVKSAEVGWCSGLLCRLRLRAMTKFFKIRIVNKISSISYPELRFVKNSNGEIGLLSKCFAVNDLILKYCSHLSEKRFNCLDN